MSLSSRPEFSKEGTTNDDEETRPASAAPSQSQGLGAALLGFPLLAPVPDCVCSALRELFLFFVLDVDGVVDGLMDGVGIVEEGFWF